MTDVAVGCRLASPSRCALHPCHEVQRWTDGTLRCAATGQPVEAAAGGSAVPALEFDPHSGGIAAIHGRCSTPGASPSEEVPVPSTSLWARLAP